MEKNRILLKKEEIFIIIAWISIYYFYFLISFWGLYDFLSAGIVKDYASNWYVHAEIISGTILFGIFFIIINNLTNSLSIRKKSFGHIILIKSFLYFCMNILVFALVYGAFYLFKLGPFEDPIVLLQFLNFKLIFSWVVFYIFSILFFNFIIQINTKIGPGNLLKLVTGRYQKPKDEKRIFLFIDLKNSTTIAEELGNNKYSKLLQSCYHDLTNFVIKYKADIYQYVGDEVVLSWNERNGLNSLNSIKLFFDYKNQFEINRNYYINNFDLIPEFKGGMDMGIVTVAEVGDIKREIAYHGDVLNTASRIQDKCREFGKDLLISENLESKIHKCNGFVKNYIGNINLKGKKKSINIYSIESRI